MVVASKADAERLLGTLQEWSTLGGVTALDTETTGCNPKKESPLGRARLWCLTLAWGTPSPDPPSPFCTAFVSREWVRLLRPWLEDDRAQKVGSNLWGYDRHVLWNEDIDLRGIVGDTIRMSRLLNPSKLLQHGLKPWGEALGYQPKEYREVASRPRRLKPKTYKRTQKRKGVLYCAGEVGQVSWTGTELIDLDELWEHYPQRRQALVDYAVQDAAMSLDVYWRLREELSEVEW